MEAQEGDDVNSLSTLKETEVDATESDKKSAQERRYVDGKWMTEDGYGGFLMFESGNWIAAEGEDLAQKWSSAASYIDPNRCMVDGVLMEWNQVIQQWLPAVEIDEDFLAEYHSSYGINYDFGPESTSKTDESVEKKKAKIDINVKKEPEGWVEIDETKNCSVYVSNLSATITDESFSQLMSKCGVIQRDARTNKPKIKLYKYEDGTVKGDGRCCYVKKESVDLALDILDGWKLEGKAVHVERAKFEMKGDFDPSKKRRKLTSAQKKRFIENQERIFDWKPEKPRNYRPLSDCTIVMKNAFTLEQMTKNASLLLDLEEETRKVCERFGVVKKVVVHHSNPEGVICVTFENVEHSDLAVRSLNSRIVDGRQLAVSLWDGRTKYNVTETDEQRAERLKHWQNYIVSD